MNKEFILYKQALALKELGFDEPCFGWWFADEEMLIIDKSTKSTSENIIQAPLYQQAFKWFREKYGLFAEITLWGDGLGYISMIKEIKQEEFIEVYQKAIIDRGLPTWSYEEAELECLKKLIEIVKEKQ
jgi:hypothetical protein